MTIRKTRKALMFACGGILILIGLGDLIDGNTTMFQQNLFSNLLFLIGGIAIIFFNTRK